MIQNDSECLDETPVKNCKLPEIKGGHDFPSMFTDLCKKLNIKVAFFLGLISFIILSDVFIENVIPNNEIYRFGNDVTSKGTIIQIIFLVVGYILIDLLAHGNMI
jgi:hypothetical protein